MGRQQDRVAFRLELFHQFAQRAARPADRVPAWVRRGAGSAGRASRARAIATRCFMPVEYFSTRSSARLVSSIRSSSSSIRGRAILAGIVKQGGEIFQVLARGEFPVDAALAGQHRARLRRT